MSCALLPNRDVHSQILVQLHTVFRVWYPNCSIIQLCSCFDFWQMWASRLCVYLALWTSSSRYFSVLLQDHTFDQDLNGSQNILTRFADMAENEFDRKHRCSA